MRSEKEKRTVVYKKKENTNDGCHFLLPSPLAFLDIISIASPTFFLRELFQCTPQDAAKLERTRPAIGVPPHIRYLCTMHHSIPSSLLPDWNIKSTNPFHL